MPIEVRHDVPAGIAALAGLMTGQGGAAVGEREALRTGGRQIVAQEAQAARQTQQLQAQRASQMRQIEAQADRQREAADTAYARTALAAGLEENIQEQQFDSEMEKLQEQARLRANQFEYEFTTEQKHGMARRNDARQKVIANVNGIYSKSDQDRMLRALDMADAGETPFPKPSDPNKLTFPKGQEPGVLWPGEGGSIMTTDPETGMPKLIQRWDQGPEAAKMKQEAALAEKELAATAKREDDIRKQMTDYRKELAKEEVETADGKSRPLHLGEIAGRMSQVFPKEMAQEAEEFWAAERRAKGAQDGEPTAGTPVEAELSQSWDQRYNMEQLKEWTSRMKVEPTEAEADLPDEVAMAQAFLRNANERVKKGEKVFPHVSRAYDAALDILEKYNAKRSR